MTVLLGGDSVTVANPVNKRNRAKARPKYAHNKEILVSSQSYSVLMRLAKLTHPTTQTNKSFAESSRLGVFIIIIKAFGLT